MTRPRHHLFLVAALPASLPLHSQEGAQVTANSAASVDNILPAAEPSRSISSCPLSASPCPLLLRPALRGTLTRNTTGNRSSREAHSKKKHTGKSCAASEVLENGERGTLRVSNRKRPLFPLTFCHDFGGDYVDSGGLWSKSTTIKWLARKQENKPNYSDQAFALRTTNVSTRSLAR